MLSSFLPRPRILRHLQAALRKGHVFVQAPGGYGKSVALRAFAASHPLTHFFPLTLADTDLPYLQSRLKPMWEERAVLILDDVHLLSDTPEVVEWLGAQMQAPEPRFILSGRAVPPLKVNAVQLGANELAFTNEESRALSQLRGARPEFSTDLNARLGGWALALDLLVRRAAVEPGIYEDSSRIIADAAVAVFGALPPDLLRFMRATAVALRFNTELAAELLDIPIEDANALLAEIHRRSLFVESLELDDPSSRAGWFRYHDLIREVLSRDRDLRAQRIHIANWFEARGDWEMAVEHALAAGLEEHAAQLLLRVPNKFIWDQYRYRTFRRWILSLGDAALAAHPNLLIRLGREIHEIGWRDEGWTYLRRGLALAEAGADHDVLVRARLSVATALSGEWRPEEALALCQQLLDDPALPLRMRERTLMVAANAYSEQARLTRARELYTQALAIAAQLNEPEMLAVIRYSLLGRALAPLGAFTASRNLMQASRGDLAHDPEPGLYSDTLLAECEVFFQVGLWDELTARLDELDRVTRRMETEWEHGQFYMHWYRGMRDIAYGEYDRAQNALERAATYASNLPDRRASILWAQVWLQRRLGNWKDALRNADAALGESWLPPYFRALVALERELAAFDHASPNPDLDPNPHDLVAMRAAPACLRLRALCALRSQARGDPRWRYHVDAARRALQRPGFAQLLTQRDPDLGERFWTLALEQNYALDDAFAALQQIGSVKQPVRLLDHPDPAVRLRAAAALQHIENDSALAHLNAALDGEGNPDVQRALLAARDHLEALPPPLIEVQLMGGFAARRSGVLIGDAEWHRPIVQRLFQYFCLHRNEPLARDRILDDLWTEGDPQANAVTFRTVYSRLRSALEPHLRPKAPSRYFLVTDDVYRFDPHDRVRTDVEQFERSVRTTLLAAGKQDILPPPDPLMAVLARYAPLLPTLPLEEWLLEPRERLHALYVEGCLNAAQALLIYHRLTEALDWAQRVIAVAPWSEEAYQVQMRAHARLGNRTLALKAYSDCVAALSRELAIPPSPLTDWLAQRLRSGEEI